MRQALVLVMACLLITACKSTPAQDKKTDAAAEGASYWVGTWEAANGKGGELHARVTPTGEDNYDAVFAGTCGQAFLYELVLPGVEHGESILFEGDVDLGEEDGGVYGWAGGIIGDTFIGEYRNQKYKAGTFRMSRATKQLFEASAQACGAIPPQ